MRPIRMLLALAAIALAFADPPARAQAVNSAAPDSVSVTIYRSPYARELDLDWLQGYALITERRTIAVPAGRATIRFEGVAAGILPESAIVAGLPEGVREKNLDADLLSPRSLYARSFGRPVTIRRTLGGKTVEERAIIRSGADGAAILETKDGFIAADCGGAPEALAYDSVPAGLSAKPTLSVETDSARAGTVTVTLSYLAWGFDWQANYVATMRPDGRSADLFAWVTLANGDVTSFADAETMVVAGRIEHDNARPDIPGGEPLSMTCFWHPVDEIVSQDGVGLLSAGLPMPAPMMARFSDEIVVTGTLATQEALGDLKLYRIPERTTVAAMSQKQVAMLDRPAVPVDILYRTHVMDDDVRPVMLTLRAQNREKDGLGVPLPSGNVAVFEPMGARAILIGEGSLADKAVGEEVEVETAEATQVTAEVTDGKIGRDWQDHVLTVTNANPHPIRFEAELETTADSRRTRASARLGRKHGHDLWAVDVPANGTATFTYRLKQVDND